MFPRTHTCSPHLCFLALLPIYPSVPFPSPFRPCPPPHPLLPLCSVLPRFRRAREAVLREEHAACVLGPQHQHPGFSSGPAVWQGGGRPLRARLCIPPQRQDSIRHRACKAGYQALLHAGLSLYIRSSRIKGTACSNGGCHRPCKSSATCWVEPSHPPGLVAPSTPLCRSSAVPVCEHPAAMASGYAVAQLDTMLCYILRWCCFTPVLLACQLGLKPRCSTARATSASPVRRVVDACKPTLCPHFSLTL